MSKLTPPSLVRAALAVFALAAAASAQVAGEARGALTNFPESQAVLHVNARRIIGEALPRLLPKSEYDKMIAESRKVGFDVRDVHSLTAGVRFAEPSQTGGFPEVLIVVRGAFSADALLALARVAASTQSIQPREESYVNKPIQVFDLTNLGRGAEGAAPGGEGAAQGGGAAKPPPFPYKEVAAVALDANTLAVGVPAYVRAAVDAANGQGRLKTSLVDLAARDPQALWSLTAELPENMAQHIQKLGVPPNEEVNRILGWLKQLSFSNGMDAVNFTLRAAVLADAPEHANAISGLVRMGLTAAESAAQRDIERKRLKPDESWQARIALNAIRTFVNRTEGNTVVLGVSVPQSALAEIIRREFVRKPAPRPRGRRRAPRRR
ncbi:MAG TPA: hypothetical protein VG148_05720 [Pyrinomonadaceae bacterium]|nr:hypothetical protein [Pyrinomonadaceae bacterium]